MVNDHLFVQKAAFIKSLSEGADAFIDGVCPLFHHNFFLLTNRRSGLVRSGQEKSVLKGGQWGVMASGF